MARGLLIRGMVAGVLAALLAVLFARAFAEPQIDLAIGFEAARAAAHHHPAEPEIVSRATQKGLGLLVTVGLYGAAVGGLFALVFAGTYGRVARSGPRTLALLLALAGFVAVALVPAFKYPPNPPAVGLHETVQMRTIAYFALLAISLAALALGVRIARLGAARFGAIDAVLAGAGAYVLLMGIAGALLPAIDEVPPAFPAVLLWRYRLAALGTQGMLWATLGIVFGLLAERRLHAAHGGR